MKYSKDKIKLIIAYFLSEYDKRAYIDLGFKTYKQACNDIGKIIGIKFNTMKNYCDEFHPITNSPKKGWWQRPARDCVKLIKVEYEKWSYLNLLREIKFIINNYDSCLLPSSRFDKSRFTFEAIKRDIESIENDKSIPKTERKTYILSRIGQGKYREQLLLKYGKSCAVTGIQTEDVLIASHIKPWCDCESKQRIDSENGLLLSSNLDKLFDHGIISFDDDGKIIISDVISEKELNKLHINKNLKIVFPLTSKQKKYMAYHRLNILKIA